jgi:hypothetical protein
MTETTSCAPAIAAIQVAFPGRTFPDATAELYGRLLADLDAAAVNRAVERLLKGDDFLPTIHRIRREVAEEALALPSPEEAWDMCLRGDLRRCPPEVREAMDAVGGRWAILRSDNPTTVRAQFLKSYNERRANVVNEYIGARALANYRRELPPQQEIGQTMASLPESATAPAPPVHARWLRRAMGKPIGDPTDAEKSHAIQVLRDGPPEHGEPDGIYIEAERIFAEAGE